MRALVSNLVALAMILHAVLGCCWHHAHETTSPVSIAEVDAQPAVTVKHCCCHSHQVEELAQQDNHRSETDAPAEPCRAPCGEKCQYVVVSRVQLDSPVAWHSFDLLPSVDQPILSPGLTTLTFESGDASVDPPPLRLHLLHQLLLI